MKAAFLKGKKGFTTIDLIFGSLISIICVSVMFTLAGNYLDGLNSIYNIGDKTTEYLTLVDSIYEDCNKATSLGYNDSMLSIVTRDNSVINYQVYDNCIMRNEYPVYHQEADVSFSVSDRLLMVHLNEDTFYFKVGD